MDVNCSQHGIRPKISSQIIIFIHFHTIYFSFSPTICLFIEIHAMGQVKSVFHGLILCRLSLTTLANFYLSPFGPAGSFLGMLDLINFLLLLFLYFEQFYLNFFINTCKQERKKNFLSGEHREHYNTAASQ
jgi:hypothetical protein